MSRSAQLATERRLARARKINSEVDQKKKDRAAFEAANPNWRKEQDIAELKSVVSILDAFVDLSGDMGYDKARKYLASHKARLNNEIETLRN